MKLKVSWAKVKRRTRILLQNIFRLRALWAKCHPHTEMRWVSYDEKPCYMNNAGLKKAFVQKGSNPKIRETFAQTRERYSLLTGVQSWPGKPKRGVCFKGAQEGGKILPALKLAFECPEFMYLQCKKREATGTQTSRSCWIGLCPSLIPPRRASWLFWTGRPAIAQM